MRTMTRTGAASLIALMCGCGPEGNSAAEDSPIPSAAADHPSPTHTRFVEQFTEPLVSPCNGEVIVFVGEAINQINDVGGLHLEFQGTASGVGTGAESGATYVYNVTGYESFNMPSESAVQDTFGAGANARMISSIPGLSFTAHFQFHGVVLPSGEIKVTRSVNRVECKG